MHLKPIHARRGGSSTRRTAFGRPTAKLRWKASNTISAFMPSKRCQGSAARASEIRRSELLERGFSRARQALKPRHDSGSAARELAYLLPIHRCEMPRDVLRRCLANVTDQTAIIKLSRSLFCLDGKHEGFKHRCLHTGPLVTKGLFKK